MWSYLKIKFLLNELYSSIFIIHQMDNSFSDQHERNFTCIEDNTDYIGRTINKCSETITNRWEECQLLCKDNPYCNFFVWMKSSHHMKNQCCLKDKIKRKIKRKGMKSGPKFCLGRYEELKRSVKYDTMTYISKFYRNPILISRRRLFHSRYII